MNDKYIKLIKYIVMTICLLALALTTLLLNITDKTLMSSSDIKEIVGSCIIAIGAVSWKHVDKKGHD